MQEKNPVDPYSDQTIWAAARNVAHILGPIAEVYRKLRPEQRNVLDAIFCDEAGTRAALLGLIDSSAPLPDLKVGDAPLSTAEKRVITMGGNVHNASKTLSPAELEALTRALSDKQGAKASIIALVEGLIEQRMRQGGK
jgi:hypothetical protein